MKNQGGRRNVLVLNIGSTSLKAASFVLAASRGKGRDDIQETGRIVAASLPGAPGTPMADDGELLAQVAQRLAGKVPTPDIIVHRIVHGGDRIDPEELTPATLADLAGFNAWAPVHQPPALALVGAAIQRYPRARQIGVFDSSWHRSMPQVHRTLAIPRSLRERGVRRYGFHGLAFQCVMRQLGVIAPMVARQRVVLAHLGGGSSLCAVLDGRSVNTTMGMTPLGGIPMATRSGSLDPGVLLHLQRGLGMSAQEIDRLLWHESGLRGISAESGDMRTLLASGSEGARLAIDVFVSGVAQGIAAMATCLNGIDALVFSGGIGTHAAEIRARVIDQLGWMGLELAAGLDRAGAQNLASNASAIHIYALPVDEETEMAIAIAPLQ
jgi:acetate kinase